LGHAVACVDADGSPGEIGFGLYLWFPVLYTRLDDVWKLPRQERARVDAAGVLFQIAFVAVVALAAAALGVGEIALAGLPAVLFTSVLGTLNPLLKFDGYWLISDFSGVANLRARSERALGASIGAFIARCRGRPYRVGESEARSRAALAAYAAGTGMFSILMLWSVVLVTSRHLQSAASALSSAVHQATHGGEVGLIASSWDILTSAVPILLPIFLFAAIGIASGRALLAFAARVSSPPPRSNRTHPSTPAVHRG
jgi:hypothetical protein